MPTVDHLKGAEAQNLFHAVAYGKHVVAGNLAKSIVTGSSPNHVITLQQMLGRGPWDGVEGIWFRGLAVNPAKYRFYPGTLTPHPTIHTFTADAGTDTFTATAHGFANGDMVIFRSGGGTLPTPIAAQKIYFVINAAANTFQVSLTSGGAAVDLTTSGSGSLQVFKNDPTQGFDAVFNTDTPHSGVAWIRAELDTGLGDADNRNSPPTGLTAICRTMKVEDYNSSGVPQGISYSTNPARQVADLIIRIGGRPTSRIDWAAWVDWRDYLGSTELQDYTTLPDFDGFGLWASYYSGTNFNTLHSMRVDSVIEFPLSSGSPAFGLNPDSFSVRWEGKIKPPYSGQWTFYVTADNGRRLWVDNLKTPIINAWTDAGDQTPGTNNASITLNANQFYDIKLEWNEGGSQAEVRLEWEHAQQPRQVIPHKYLYPKAQNRPRYETHPFFSSPTRLDDAVRTILNLCNSTVQEVNGKLRFFCLEQLTTPSFHFTNNEIIDGSLRITPRNIATQRNSWQAAYRDVDSQYLEPPLEPLIIEREDMIEKAGRKIDGEAIQLFNCTRWQAYKTLNNLVKREVDSKFRAELTGNADTLAVIAGDRVKLDVEFRDWTDKQMLVLESHDASSEETADERIFVMQEWTL